MKKYYFALCLLCVLAMTTVLSLTSYASDVTIPEGGSADGEVCATFTVDESTLDSLGCNVIASIPVTLPLSYNNSTKSFSNTATIYCSGVLPAGKQASITVNESATKYGNILYPDNNSSSVKGKTGFSISLTKTVWSKSECYSNLSRIRNSQNASATGTLSVAVPGRGFLPSSTGTFKTYVPLVISREDTP